MACLWAKSWEAAVMGRGAALSRCFSPGWLLSCWLGHWTKVRMSNSQ